LLTLPVRAQPDTDALLRRQDDQQLQLRQRQEAGADVRLQAPPGQLPPSLPTDEVPCAVIRQVRVNAAGLPFDDGALSGPGGNDPPEGRCLGTQGIALLVARAQDAFVARGFVTTRVAAAGQDLRDGLLELTVAWRMCGRQMAPMNRSGGVRLFLSGPQTCSTCAISSRRWKTCNAPPVHKPACRLRLRPWRGIAI
jgi:hemolysin activation/secretion protein